MVIVGSPRSGTSLLTSALRVGASLVSFESEDLLTLPAQIDWSDQHLVVMKSCLYRHRLNDVVKLFPQAMFIHLIRDGRDVARSIMNLPGWTYRPEDAANEWVSSVTSIQRQVLDLSLLCVQLHYETLVSSFASEISKLCLRIGHPYVDQMSRPDLLPETSDLSLHPLNWFGTPATLQDKRASQRRLLEPPDSGSVGLWKTLPSDDLSRILSIETSLLTELGYLV